MSGKYKLLKNYLDCRSIFEGKSVSYYTLICEIDGFH
jgi:hypothetical protein